MSQRLCLPVDGEPEDNITQDIEIVFTACDNPSADLRDFNGFPCKVGLDEVYKAHWRDANPPRWVEFKVSATADDGAAFHVLRAGDMSIALIAASLLR